MKENRMSSIDFLKRIGIDGSDNPGLMTEGDTLETPTTALVMALRERLDSLDRRARLKPGDLVRWKAGLRNRLLPKPGMPAIVLEVLAPAVLDSCRESGSPYFREPLDVIIGVFIDEGEHRGDFVNFHIDSRRLEIFPTEEC